MLAKYFIVSLLLIGLLQKNDAAPLEMTDADMDSEDDVNYEKVIYELQELKRVTRQCPFSGGGGGFGGAGGAGGPDIGQLMAIARTVLNAMDQNGVGGVGNGGNPLAGGIDTNQIARFRQRG